jgi:hypothetical protein
MATKVKEVVEEQPLTEGQFRINVGDADREYIHALNQLVNVPGGTFEFKQGIKRLARQLQARVEVVTAEMYKSIADLGRMRQNIQRAERSNSATDEMFSDLTALEEVVEQKQRDAYALNVVLDGPKLKKSQFPKADNLAKPLSYQAGNTHVQTDYTAMYAIIADEFVEA